MELELVDQIKIENYLIEVIYNTVKGEVEYDIYDDATNKIGSECLLSKALEIVADNLKENGF